MSWVLYFVYPCACSEQNGLYQMASVLCTPTEEFRRQVDGVFGPRAARGVSAPQTLLEDLGSETRSQCVSTGEQHQPPKRNTDVKKDQPQSLGVKRNTKIDVCWFSVLFWLLQYQEGVGGGAGRATGCLGEVFVLLDVLLF